MTDAMIAHPILINRPLIIASEGVKLCRPSETVRELLPQFTLSATNRNSPSPFETRSRIDFLPSFFS